MGGGNARIPLRRQCSEAPGQWLDPGWSPVSQRKHATSQVRTPSLSMLLSPKVVQEVRVELIFYLLLAVFKTM